MKILALDLGTKCGYAGCLDEEGYSGVWDLTPKRMESPGMRYLRFRKLLETLHEAHAIDLVAFEEVRRHAGTAAAHVYGGLKAIVTAFCAEHGINYTSYPVGTIKKHATGKGNAGKDAMIAAAEEKGWMPKDDNEADALWVLDMAKNEYNIVL